MTGKNTIHLIIETARQQIRQLLKERTEATGSGGGTLAGLSVLDAGDTDFDPSDQNGGELSPVGIRYNVWPLERFEFETLVDRFLNLDEFVGIPFIEAMRGLAADGGHQHSGVDGDAPQLPATSILTPDGVPGPTLEDWLLEVTNNTDSALSTAANGREQLWDDFETADQSSRWETTAGTPSRIQDSTENWRYLLPTATVLRARGSAFSWINHLGIRLDLYWANTGGQCEVRLRSRATASGHTYVVGFRNGNTAFIGDMNNVTGVMEILAEGFTIPHDVRPHTVQVVLWNRSITVYGEDSQFSVTLDRDDSADAGYLEVHSPGSDCRIDNVLVQRLVYSGNISVTHEHYEVNGTDLDVSDLQDAEGRLLTGSERAVLTNDENADALHTHAGVGLEVGDDVPNAVGVASNAGTSEDAAAADHRHAIPHWLVEFYISGQTGADFPVDDYYFDSGPLAAVREQRLPTVDGTFHWTSYGKGLAFRASLPIMNAGAERTVTLRLPALQGVCRVKLKNDVDDLELFFSDESNHQLGEEIEVTLRGSQVNTLYLYGSNWSTDKPGSWWLTSDESEGLFDPAKSLSFYEG